MIDARELRIGNYVSILHADQGRFWIIRELHKEAAVFPDKGFKSYEKLEPIPLTEEWLTKLGFIKDQAGNYYLKIGDFYWMASLEENTYTIWSECETALPVSYVHELQNLAWVLTKTELTINNLINV